MSSPADHNPEELLVRWWQRYTAIDQDDGLATDRRHAITAPFGQTCPELTPALAASADPDAVAEQHLRDFLLHNAHLHLGLVAASGGADALAAVGWNGPLNYDGDTATFAAVVRDWENRFGARVVSVGLATPHLSVAAPPARHEDALLVAAEHFAFCPDTIWQGSYSTLAAYAESLFDAKCWEFWWDCPGRPICERRSFSRWTPRRPVVCVMAGERAGHDAPPPPPAGGNRRE
ncbi:DUF4253 domain-containing protein [Streptomyces sp. NPDC006733]|uniref:DUF4253 domain-containing protein n=1 Tax=Streptomyces sp. NPDC006733 TaxID=3155460 RepID=UPI0033DDF6BA